MVHGSWFFGVNRTGVEGLMRREGAIEFDLNVKRLEMERDIYSDTIHTTITSSQYHHL